MLLLFSNVRSAYLLSCCQEKRLNNLVLELTKEEAGQGHSLAASVFVSLVSSVCRCGLLELVPVRHRRLRRPEPAVLGGALQHSQERVGGTRPHAPLSQRARSHRLPGPHLCPRSVALHKSKMHLQLVVQCFFLEDFEMCRLQNMYTCENVTFFIHSLSWSLTFFYFLFNRIFTFLCKNCILKFLVVSA